MYKLTLADKVFLAFHDDYDDCYNYLFPKVKEYYIKLFNNHNQDVPEDYEKTVSNIVEELIFKY